MTTSIAKGTSDTAITFSPDTVSLAHLNWAADWQLRSEKVGEALYYNANSPSDQEETLRISYQRVPNIYSGTGIDPKNQPAIKSGVRIYVELRQIWKKTSSTDDTLVVLFPLRGGQSCTIPDAADVTGLNDYADIEAFMRRSFSTLYAQSSVTHAGLKKLLRGVLAKA